MDASSLIIPSSVSKSSYSHGGLDENESFHVHDQIDFTNTKSPRKSVSSTKHYMSPTISAASKASLLPRKKILTDTKGVPDVQSILHAKPFNLSPKMSSPTPRSSTNSSPDNVKYVGSEPSSGVDTKASAKYSTNGLDDVQIISMKPLIDSSLKPYDPVTNYLSPRPKFLRYNPNRRPRIFHQSENETAVRGFRLDAKRGLSFDTQKYASEGVGSSVSCSDNNSGKDGDEKTDNENAEEDASESSVFSFEEDNDGSSVFSSEEDPEYEKTSNEVAENYVQEEGEIVFESERFCSLKRMLQFLFLVVCLIFSTHYIMIRYCFSSNTEAACDLKSHHQKYHYDLNFTEGAIESTLWGKSEIKCHNIEIDDSLRRSFVIKKKDKISVYFTCPLYEMDVEEQEMQTENVGTKEETNDKLGLPNIEAKEVHEEKSLEIINKASDYVEGFEIEKAEECPIELQGSEASEMYENDNDSGLGSNDVKMGSGDEIEPLEEVLDQGQVKDIGNNEVNELVTRKVESVTLSPESDPIEFAFPKAKLDLIQAIVIVAPIMVLILASFIFAVYYLKQKKGHIEESSSTAVEPQEEPVVAEPPSMEEEKLDGAEIIASTSSTLRKARGNKSVPQSQKGSNTTRLDLSSADSNSLDGSSTAKKKKRRKDAETTPIRRSLRQNKASMNSHERTHRSQFVV